MICGDRVDNHSQLEPIYPIHPIEEYLDEDGREVGRLGGWDEGCGAKMDHGKACVP